MNIVKKGEMNFIGFKEKNINILFSTADNNISYKLVDRNAKKNFKILKDAFKVEKVNYTNQVHGDEIILVDKINSTNKEADGLILSRKNEIIGVFTADCVPVILYDSDKEVIATIHSGWKGTIKDISLKAVNLMKKEYNCENIKAIIGPCIGKCCYEVSNELANEFKIKYGNDVIDGKMLDLVLVIKKTLAKIIGEKNINSLDICTNCSDINMHSYRKDKEDAGRLFSFAYIELEK
ncbi:MAG: peptidoglycan editing factor PgeF [Sarcina sp.]